MAEESAEKASMVQVKQIIRRRLRRAPEHTSQELNIYPLMDVMTILLVFMIMQFAAETSHVMQSPELQIPYSTSEADLETALSLTISRTGIMVDQRPVLSLRNGIVDPSQKRDGGTGFLINPLHDRLVQHAERQRQMEERSGGTRPFTGTVQIIADERTPFRTLSEVIYTLGQAEFSNIHFVVLQED